MARRPAVPAPRLPRALSVARQAGPAGAAARLLEEHGAGEALAAAALVGLDGGADPGPWCQALGVPEPGLSVRREAARSGFDALSLLAAVHEESRRCDDRRRHGAVYTPPALADRLVDLATEGMTPPRRVLDPSVGAGAFLVAAARALARLGVPVEEIVGRRLHGLDVDTSAVAVTRVAVARWSHDMCGRAHWVPPGNLRPGDLLEEVGTPELGRFDLVVGNPPFGGQLRGATVRDAARYRHLARAHGLGGFGYADTSLLFLLAGCSVLRGAGRVSLVLPQPVLAARGAAPLRERIAEMAHLRSVWWAAEEVFDAGVRVWAPALVRRGAGPPPAQIIRRRGVAMDAVSPLPAAAGAAASTWTGLVADLAGAPTVHLTGRRASGTLADLASATAGFRRHFYAMSGAVCEAPADRSARPRLVTVGAVDPARCGWGVWPLRFARSTWARPVVDPARLAAVDATVAAWVHDRLRPKVLVATQTAVVEAVADAEGRIVPSTPLLSVEPVEPADVMRVAAVLLAPPVSAWLVRRHTGSGLSGDTVRVSARDLVLVPLPSEVDPWEEGALHAAAAHAAAASGDATGWSTALDRLGHAMTCAYGMAPDHPVVGWWRSRRPGWRSAPAESRMGSARGAARDDGRL